MVRNKECPKCRELGHDKTGDHLFLMKDGLTWGCFKPYHAPYKVRDGQEEGEYSIVYERETLEDVNHYPIFDKDYRGIRGEFYEKFSIRYAVKTDTGEPEFLYYPIYELNGEHIGFHVRNLLWKDGDKTPRFYNIGNISGKKKLLFGIKESSLSGKKIIITEGHQDMLAGYQMLYDKYPAYEPLILSLNGGTGQIQDISDNIHQLNNFKEVILCFDNDTAGEDLTDRGAKLLGTNARVMHFSEKDANDMLENKKCKEFISAFFSARMHLPTDIVSTADLVDDIMTPINIDITYPYEGLNDLTYGIFKGQIISIGAGVGTGKSVFIDSITRHLVFNHNAKVGLFSLEEHPSYTMKKLIGGILHTPIHLPGITPNEEDVKGILSELEDRLYLYNSQGYRDMGDIEHTIRYLASLGVSYFFIDPLTAVVAELSSSEANERLGAFCATLSSLVVSLNITVFLVSHLNNPKTGKAHSEGGRVSGEQLTNSRAAYRWSHVVLGLERNLQADNEKEKNSLLVRVIKNRIIGKTGTIILEYNPDTYQLEEQVNAF